MFGLFKREKSAQEVLFDLKIKETEALLRRDQEGIREIVAHPVVKRAEEVVYGQRSILATLEELRSLDRSWTKARMPRDYRSDDDPYGMMWWGVRILSDSCIILPTTTHSAKEEGS